ncbi:hypothetical protein ACJ73_08430 [Blastomyces percursus]|uniref:Uncharacterized protein n=1 Tax=Blastomyces percursus TaxID=1658174 RepID=A0A1J9PVB5_9EURO|nr:hypothetical protein ACJ73_08430 [Blastomyces percursus]
MQVVHTASGLRERNVGGWRHAAADATAAGSSLNPSASLTNSQQRSAAFSLHRRQTFGRDRLASGANISGEGHGAINYANFYTNGQNDACGEGVALPRTKRRRMHQLPALNGQVRSREIQKQAQAEADKPATQPSEGSSPSLSGATALTQNPGGENARGELAMFWDASHSTRRYEAINHTLHSAQVLPQCSTNSAHSAREAENCECHSRLQRRSLQEGLNPSLEGDVIPPDIDGVFMPQFSLQGGLHLSLEGDIIPPDPNDALIRQF